MLTMVRSLANTPIFSSPLFFRKLLKYTQRRKPLVPAMISCPMTSCGTLMGFISFGTVTTSITESPQKIFFRSSTALNM